MNYQVEEAREKTTIFLSGELDMAVGELVGQIIAQYGSRCESLSVDFRDVTFVDSAGIGSLFYTTKDLLAEGKRVEIINVQEDIYDVLQVLGFAVALGITIKQVE